MTHQVLRDLDDRTEMKRCAQPTRFCVIWMRTRCRSCSFSTASAWGWCTCMDASAWPAHTGLAPARLCSQLVWLNAGQALVQVQPALTAAYNPNQTSSACLVSSNPEAFSARAPPLLTSKAHPCMHVHAHVPSWTPCPVPPKPARVKPSLTLLQK